MDTRDKLLRSSATLQRQMAAHHALVARLIEQGPEADLDSLCEEGAPDEEDCAERLRAALLEAIEVLEGTRKAFKSKQLEMLRKKLIGILADKA